MRELKLKNGMRMAVKNKPELYSGVIEVEDMDKNFWAFPLT